MKQVSLVNPGKVEEWLKNRLGELLGMKSENIPGDADFERLGVDSAQAVNLMMEIETWLDLPDELPLELLFDEPAISRAAEAIAAEANRILADHAGNVA